MGLAERVAEWTFSVEVDTTGRPSRLDFVVATFFAAAAIVNAPFVDSGLHMTIPLVGGLASAVLMLWRRAAPLVLLAGVIAVEAGTFLAARLTDTTFEPTRVQNITLVIAIYTAARWGPERTIAVTSTIAIVAVPAIGLLNPGEGQAWAFGYLLTVLGFTVIGLYVRATNSLQSERSLARRLNDRNRLANDIHDSVAHHMSAIALAAESARDETDLTELHNVLEAIHRSASTSLTDMRQLIFGLRTARQLSKPLPTLNDLHDLAQRSPIFSPSIQVTLGGNHENLPITVSSAAYYIAREAITNARRHAKSATAIRIHAELTGTFLDLTIHDNGTTNTDDHGPGHGTRAMTQRARELGGDLTAGPDPEHGWTVTARLPINPTRMP